MRGLSRNFLLLSARRAVLGVAVGLAVAAVSPNVAWGNEVVRAVPAAWHGEGHWGWHGGRWGWWWIGPAGVWTWYAFNPYYPYYPAYGYPYYPYYGYPYPPAESTQPMGNLPPPPQYWYYCESAKGYYPHIAACPEGWRPVPAQPEGPGPAPAPPGKSQ